MQDFTSMRHQVCVFLCLVCLQNISPIDSFLMSSMPEIRRQPYNMLVYFRQSHLSASSADSADSIQGGQGDAIDYSKEETLLCVDFTIDSGVDLDDALEQVSKYCQSFPFAAVLPVQPLHYVPVYEDGGVEVKFLRKKTDMKSANDGGLRFFIEKRISDKADGSENDCTIEVTAKRNSKGQVIGKLMSEKLVVTSFVAGITGEETTKYGVPPPVHVKSMYHKWM